MKNIFSKFMVFAFVGVVTSVFLVGNAQAAAVVRVSEAKPSFEIVTKAINKIAFTDKSRLDFQTANIKNPQLIDSWKMRVWCNKGISVGFGPAGVNTCGKVMTLTNEQVKLFSLYLTNQTNVQAEFSFKLKAYGKNGKWLHTQGKSFLW